MVQSGSDWQHIGYMVKLVYKSERDDNTILLSLKNQSFYICGNIIYLRVM